LKKLCVILLILSMFLNLTVSAKETTVTVSSECDISDINEPLETATTNAAIGQSRTANRKQRTQHRKREQDAQYFFHFYHIYSTM